MRNRKHDISLAKHIAIGALLGMMGGTVIAVIYPDYFLSIWGKDYACPIITGERNIIGCSAAFIYFTEFIGIILGGFIGLVIGIVRKLSIDPSKGVEKHTTK